MGKASVRRLQGACTGVFCESRPPRWLWECGCADMRTQQLWLSIEYPRMESYFIVENITWDAADMCSYWSKVRVLFRILTCFLSCTDSSWSRRLCSHDTSGSSIKLDTEGGQLNVDNIIIIGTRTLHSRFHLLSSNTASAVFRGISITYPGLTRCLVERQLVRAKMQVKDNEF